MPLPSRRKYERERPFMARCMRGMWTNERERWTADGQKAAICYSQFRRNPPLDLGLATVVEQGIRFSTGEPVTFRYLRNTVSSQGFRDTRSDLYQQKIDPAGRFMSHVEDPVLQEDPSGRTAWETGLVTFRSPLVLWLNNGPEPRGIYDEHSWKARLVRHYGAVGPELSAAIMKDGHDGIVTADVVRGRTYTSEIVDLRWGRERGWFNNPPLVTYRLDVRAPEGMIGAVARHKRSKVGWVAAVESPEYWDVVHAFVHRDFQRHGIASRLYNMTSAEACKRGKPLRSQGRQRSPAATMVWEQLEGAVPVDKRRKRFQRDFRIPCKNPQLPCADPYCGCAGEGHACAGCGARSAGECQCRRCAFCRRLVRGRKRGGCPVNVTTDERLACNRCWGALPPGLVSENPRGAAQGNPLDRHYVEGGCYHLALAMHELTGWPVVALVSGDTGSIDHAGVVTPDGRFADGGGACGSPAEAADRWGLRAVPMTAHELASRTVVSPVDAHDRDAAEQLAREVSR